MNKKEIESICKEIFSCSKCPHMKTDGVVRVVDDNGVEESIYFRPYIPDYNDGYINNNYELMSIGTNPGYNPLKYTEDKFKCKNFEKYKEKLDENFHPGPYEKNSLCDFLTISKNLSSNNINFLNSKNYEILHNIKSNIDKEDYIKENFYKVVYWGNLVFCPSKNIYAGEVNKNKYRMIDTKYSSRICKQYIFRIMNIVKPKAICIYCKSIFDPCSGEDIYNFFSFKTNNGNMLHVFSKKIEIEHTESYRLKKKKKITRYIKYCLASYDNDEAYKCAIFFLNHPSREKGENRDSALAKACKNIVNKL